MVHLLTVRLIKFFLVFISLNITISELSATSLNSDKINTSRFFENASLEPIHNKNSPLPWYKKFLTKQQLNLLLISETKKTSNRIIPNIVELLDLGADPNFSNKHLFGTTPLHHIAKDADLTLIRYFLKQGGNPYIQNIDGINALMVAIFHKNNFAVEEILNSKFTNLNRLNQNDINNNDIITYCGIANNFEALQIILKSPYLFELTTINRREWNLLMYFTKHKNHEAIDFLLNNNDAKIVTKFDPLFQNSKKIGAKELAEMQLLEPNRFVDLPSSR